MIAQTLLAIKTAAVTVATPVGLLTIMALDRIVQEETWDEMMRVLNTYSLWQFNNNNYDDEIAKCLYLLSTIHQINVILTSHAQ